jgi:hypothetical protein
MSTSANVIEYRIEKSGVSVGSYRQHLMCKSHYEELLKYEPLKEHTITAWGYDEDDEEWEDKPINLEDFLREMISTNKVIKEYFSS